MDYCKIKYNLGRFRLINGHHVYYLLFGYIPIFITILSQKEFYSENERKGRLEAFHDIVKGYDLKKGIIWKQ